MDDSINTNYDPINTITIIVKKTLTQLSKKTRKIRILGSGAEVRG